MKSLSEIFRPVDWIDWLRLAVLLIASAMLIPLIGFMADSSYDGFGSYVFVLFIMAFVFSPMVVPIIWSARHRPRWIRLGYIAIALIGGGLAIFAYRVTLFPTDDALSGTVLFFVPLAHWIALGAFAFVVDPSRRHAKEKA